MITNESLKVKKIIENIRYFQAGLSNHLLELISSSDDRNSHQIFKAGQDLGSDDWPPVQ